MNGEAKELWSFLRFLEANPRDVQAHKVFADWLDEHDCPEEADKQRSFDLAKYDAEMYLKDFCRRYRANYADLLKEVAAGEGYCFGDDYGPDVAREDPEFWRCIALLTGKDVAEDSSLLHNFRCAC